MEALRFAPDAPAAAVGELPADPGGEIWCDLARTDLAGGARPTHWLDRLHPLTALALGRDRPRHLTSAQPGYAHIRLQVPADGRTLSLDVVFGSGFALTVGARELPDIARLWAGYARGERRAGSVAFALYEALSLVVDAYRQAVDRGAAEAEDVAERLVRLSERHILREIVRVRRHLQALRTDVAPAVDGLGLISARAEATGEDPRPYLEDVHRQIREALDVVDSARESMGEAVEAYTSVQSTEMNRVMQIFTVVAVLFMPPTLIASIYGMNFRIPEYAWPAGYAWALGLMALITGAGYLWLRARHWL